MTFSDRNVGVEESDTSSTKSVEYKRDVSDRIVERISKNNGATVSHEKHIYSGSGSSPSAILNQNDAVLYKYLSLPGGVSLKINPNSTSAGAKTYSLSNLHNDTMATVNADGMVTGTFITGPFGEKLANTILPQNATADTSYEYVGKHQKVTETSFSTQLIQMGARVYIPELGRFLQVDPVEGGTDNSYVYVNDPVNSFDLNGRWSFGGFINSVVQTVTRAIKTVVVATVNTVVKAVSQVVVSAAYYGAWLHGGGRSYTVPAQKYTWSNAQSKDFRSYRGQNGTRPVMVKGTINAGTPEGFLVVNGASAQLTGTLTVNGNSWSFSGKATSIRDTYNFEHQPTGGLMRNAFSWAGRTFGGACEVLRSCSPKDYDIYLPGEVNISGSGSF